MRYSRMENSRHKQPGGPRKAWFFVAFVLVIGVGVYIIGAAKVGNFISEKIVTPVVAWVTGEDAKDPSAANPSAPVSPSPSPSEETPVSYTHLDVYKRQISPCVTLNLMKSC